MSEPSLQVSTLANATTLCLNRPQKCNALDGPLIAQLQAAFLAAERDSNTQVVILKGEGAHFCAGADIEWMRTLADSSFEQNRDDAQNLASLLLQMYSFPKPIIAVAQGTVLGGGLGLLACSDLVLAARESYFCFSEVKIGLVPAVISPYIIAAIGERAARYYFLTAERFNVDEAQRLGLVHHVLPAETLENGLASTVQKLLKNAPAALREVKRLMTTVVGQEKSLELAEKTAEIFAKTRVSSEAGEGLKAFLEKRPPLWS